MIESLSSRLRGTRTPVELELSQKVNELVNAVNRLAALVDHPAGDGDTYNRYPRSTERL